MKCHYDVLELARDADDAAIKTAYRKLALRWHPDKNLDNPEEAKAKFQVIQQAYEVLSDQQERAWYDRHREQILRGSDNYTDDALDVFQYFTVTCYRGYDDSAGAFYSVYRDIFERLAAEDLEFIDSDDSDDGSRIPGFGRSDSDYETVVGPFYAYWMAYSTRKTFAWLCPHNVAEIRDRRILRHVEKETGKLAQKARKERNDEVRALVAFVKKRDRRVVEWRRLLEQRAEQNRLKQEEKRLEQIRRNRAEVEEQMRVQREAGGSHFGQADYEAKLRKMEAAYGRDSDDESEDEEDEDDEEAVDAIGERLEKGATIEDDPDQAEEEEEEVYIDHLYCVACNKAFKNESSMQNHQSSKRHKDNIEKLRLQMLDEEDAHNAAKQETSSSESEESPLPAVSNKQSKKARRKAQKVNRTASASEDEEEEKESATATPAEPAEEAAEDVASVKDDAAEGADDNPTPVTKKSKRRAKKAADPNPAQPKPSASSASKSGRSQKRQQLLSSDDDDGHDDQDWGQDQRRGGKAPTKAAARKAAAAAAARKPAISEIDETVDIDHTCVTCAAVFDSKNKLFAHLKKLNHGVYIEGKGVSVSRAAVAAAAAAEAAQARGGKGRRK